MMAVSVVVRGGLIVDGTGSSASAGDIAIAGDRIVAIGEIPQIDGAEQIDASGCMVAPGFINVLSHAYNTLQQDPRGLSDLYQGVTTQVFGEGTSLGPVCGRLTPAMMTFEGDPENIRTSWPTLRAFLEELEERGVGQNVASFVGATNLRMSVAGLDEGPLTEAQLQQACALLEAELAEGALGVGSALIYPPGSYADTAELTAYARVLARHDGLYISHLRNEGDRLLEAVDELIQISRETGARAEIYHLKTAGRHNWEKIHSVIDHVEDARTAGIKVTADIYPYAAGGTDLSASIPPQFHLGGLEELQRRLRSREGREAIATALRDGGEWEDLWKMSGGADGVVMLSAHPGIGVAAGSSIAEIALSRGDEDPVMTLMDIVEAAPLARAAYFAGNEDNLRIAFERPWVSVCSDAEALSLDEQFADHPVHPRAYGSFARVLGRYARDEQIVSVEEAVRRMTSLPADNLRLSDRGVLRDGAYADLAVFQLEDVLDHATYARPAAYASGMRHVLVNGLAALRDGQPTGALNGRAIRRAAHRSA